MKNFEELMKEAENSVELQNEIKAVNSPEELVEFLKVHDCEVKPEEIQAFAEKYATAEGELSYDETEAVAGGDNGLFSFFRLFSSAFWSGVDLIKDAVESIPSGSGTSINVDRKVSYIPVAGTVKDNILEQAKTKVRAR